MKKTKKIKIRAIELFHKDTPFKPKIVSDKKKKLSRKSKHKENLE